MAKKTLKDLAEELLAELKDSLRLTKVEVEDEDPSFVTIRLYEEDDVVVDDDDDKLAECGQIANVLARKSLELWDEYEERYIQYDMIDDCVEYDGDWYNVWLREK